MGTPEPDQYLTGSLVNSLPTCTFPPRPYPRKITRILVANSATSSVAVYRSSLSSFPVAQNPIGNANTLMDVIKVPAGQPFFVQWSVVGTNVRDATARVTLEKDDNPFDVDTSQGWAVSLVTSITIPNTAGPNDSAIIIGQDIPAQLQAYYTGAGGPNLIVVGNLIFRLNATHYKFLALIKDNIGNFSLAVGSNATGTLIEDFRISGNSTPGLMQWSLHQSETVQFNGSDITLSGIMEFLSGCQVILDAGATATFNGLTTINPSSGIITAGGNNDILIDGNSTGRGLVARTSDNSNVFLTPANSTAELDITTLHTTALFKTGRAYSVRIHGYLDCGTVNNVTFRCHLTTAAGTTIGLFGVFNIAFASLSVWFPVNAHIYVKNTTGADITRTLVPTMNALVAQPGQNEFRGGGVTVGTNEACLEIYDEGPASAFPNAFAIT